MSRAVHCRVSGAQLSQSRAMSLVESIANVAVGFGVALLTQTAVFPLFGLRVPLASHLVISAIFTLVSISRSYLLRRAFEAIRLRSEQRNAAGI